MGDAELTRRTLNRAKKAPFFGAHNLIHGLKAGIPCWAWVSEGVAVLKTGKIYMSDGQEKARFLTVWRQKKTDLVLRTSIKGYSVTLALNHALDMANYIKTEDVSNNENRKLVKNWAIVHRISYSSITTPKTR